MFNVSEWLSLSADNWVEKKFKFKMQKFNIFDFWDVFVLLHLELVELA